MTRSDTTEAKGRPPRGVTILARSRGGRRYRASIKRGKGVEFHLGLYESPWLAAFAYNVAAEALGRGGGMPANAIPDRHQPTADQVRAITARVRRRLGLDRSRPATAPPPRLDDLRTFFEITVVGFWRGQAAEPGDPIQGLDAAARRVVEAANLLFWDRSAGHPEPLEVLSDLLARRIDQAFRRADLARGVLDDDGDDPFRLARWLVLPDAFPAARGFREELRHLYPEAFGARAGKGSGDGQEPLPDWAEALGLRPPFTAARVRLAYRTRSKSAHPDAGGSDEAFVQLQAAYAEALEYCEAMES